MTTRLLQGVQRTGPGKWTWGCWEIEAILLKPAVPGQGKPWVFWLAHDTSAVETPAVWHERIHHTFDLFPRDFLMSLALAGPEPAVNR